MAIKVTVFNRKGGVGKTTLAIILTQIALMKGKTVFAVEQDEQNNFNVSVSYLQHEPRFKDKFTLKTSLTKEDFNSAADWIIIDCPPSFNDRTRLALRNSDFILIPVRPDSYSTMPFSQIHQEAGDYKKLFQFPIVKVGFDGKIPSRIADEKITELTSKGLIVIGNLPLYSTITANISSDRKKWWSVGLQAQARQPFELIYTRLELLHKKLEALRKEKDERKRGENVDPFDPENPDLAMFGRKQVSPAF